MDTGLYRIELTALAGLVRIAGIGGGFSGDPEKTAPEQARRAGSLWFPAALVIGFGAWILLSGYSSKPAEGETASPATAVTNITLDGSMLNPPATPEQVTAAAEMAPVQLGLRFHRNPGEGADWDRKPWSRSRSATATPIRSRTSRFPAPLPAGTAAI
jgi:hypothetical protein